MAKVNDVNDNENDELVEVVRGNRCRTKRFGIDGTRRIEPKGKKKRQAPPTRRVHERREKKAKEEETRTVADGERGLTMPQILVPAVECPRAHTTHN